MQSSSYGIGCADCDTARLGLGYLRGGMGDDGGDPTIVDVVPPELPAISASDCAFGGVYPNCNASPYAPSLTTSPLTVAATGAPVSSGNSALDNALASIAAQWTKIAGQTIAPQTTITTPQGLQVQTPAGQTSSLASLFAGSSLTSATGSVNFTALLPWLLIGGAGLLAVKALGK